MLRGINRSIIEINETENRYFEKIIVFVRPEFGGLSQSQLQKEAVRMVSNMSALPMGLKRRTSARRRAALKRRKIICGCALVLLAAAVILAICLI